MLFDYLVLMLQVPFYVFFGGGGRQPRRGSTFARGTNFAAGAELSQYGAEFDAGAALNQRRGWGGRQPPPMMFEEVMIQQRVVMIKEVMIQQRVR